MNQDRQQKELFASRIRNLRASGIRKIFNLSCTMGDCIDLSIGQGDYDVPTPIKQAAAQAIHEGFNRYTVTGGISELRDGIVRQLREKQGLHPEAALVTAGASGALVLACLTMVEPGDEVLIPDPYFVLYRKLVELCGGIPVFYDTYPDFRPRQAEIEGKITAHTKMILINSPQNPTGACYSAEELQMIAAVASRHDLLVVSDEVYAQFAYDAPPLSMLQFYPRTLLVSGFSKSLAMPGWRIGYAAGPEAIINTMETLQQFTFVCMPSPLQRACAAHLDYDISANVSGYRRRRDLVFDGLRDHFEVSKPGGAFYLFIKVPWPGRTATEFVTAAVKRKLLLVPGIALSNRDTHFRLSFAAPTEKLEAAIGILREMALQPV